MEACLARPGGARGPADDAGERGEAHGGGGAVRMGGGIRAGEAPRETTSTRFVFARCLLFFFFVSLRSVCVSDLLPCGGGGGGGAAAARVKEKPPFFTPRRDERRDAAAGSGSALTGLQD